MSEFGSNNWCFLRENSYSLRPNHSIHIEILSKLPRDDLVDPMHNVDQDYDGVTAIDLIWEDVMNICFSLEDIRKSPLAKEHARFADIKAQVRDLEEAVFCFKETSAHVAKVIEPSTKASHRHPTP